jgi:hypothetical protein
MSAPKVRVLVEVDINPACAVLRADQLTKQVKDLTERALEKIVGPVVTEVRIEQVYGVSA